MSLHILTCSFMRNVPTMDTKHPLWELEPRGPLPDDNTLHLLESFGLVHDQGCRIGVFSDIRIQDFHFEQRFPRRHFRITNIVGARILSLPT